MPDHTTTSAAAYLTERGYTVHSKRDGTDTPPSPTTVKQWCERGKIKARKAGWVWLIEQKTLDELLEESSGGNFSGHSDGAPAAIASDTSHQNADQAST